MLPLSHRRGVENETYGRIDTIFLKSGFPAENVYFKPCSQGFYDFQENEFFAGAKEIIFVIAFWTRFPAFEARKTRAREGRFLSALDPKNRKNVKNQGKVKKVEGDGGRDAERFSQFARSEIIFIFLFTGK